MRSGTLTIRLVALAVLLASFSDYWAYDRWDPTAPMNSSGPETVAGLDLHAPSGARLRSANLSDDHCLCCSPLVSPAAPAIPLPALGALPRNESAGPDINAISQPISICASPPFHNATALDLPLRI